MEREVNRLKAADAKYGLDFADKAENLERKFKVQQRENNDLLYYIDGNPGKRFPEENVPILGSGGFYVNFGNNREQKRINQAALCEVKKCKKL